MLVVAGISDDSAPHLRLLVVCGPGFRSGLLVSPSTRQRGLALLPDLPVSVLHWLGRPVPPAAAGQVLHRASRSSLAAALSGLIGQDTAAQVYRGTVPRFFLIAGLGYVALFVAIAVFWDGAARAGGWSSPGSSTASRPGRGASFDALDVPPDRFLTAPRAWQLARSGAVDPERFVTDPDLEIPAT